MSSDLTVRSPSGVGARRRSPPPDGATAKVYATLARRWAQPATATRGLILVQVWIFVLPFSLGLIPATVRELLEPGPAGRDWLHYLGALLPLAETRAEPWRLLTSAYLHASVLHLTFNMWALRSVGSLLERLGGSRRFLLIYVLAGLAAMLGSAGSRQAGISVGASGAIFGLATASVATVYRLRTQLPPRVARRLGIPLGFLVVAMLVVFPVIDRYLGFNVDHAAHTTGAVAGAFLGLAPVGSGNRIFVKLLGVVSWLLLATSVVIPTTRALLAAPGPVASILESSMPFPFREEHLERFLLKLRVPISWDRIEVNGLPAWTVYGQTVLSLNFEPAPVRDTPDILSHVDLLRRSYERQKARGFIDRFEVILEEDMLGEGVGGYLIGVILEPQGIGILHRLLDTPSGAMSFMLRTLADESEILRAEAVLRSIERGE